MHSMDIKINTDVDYLCTFLMIATVISFFPRHNPMIDLRERDLYVCDVGVCDISGSYSDYVEDSFFLVHYDSM